MISSTTFGHTTPWSISDKSPVILEKSKAIVSETSFWDNRFDYGYYFYQKVISPADGARCEFYPTCTDYGYQAIQKHGLFLGGWMATDRFMRDHGHPLEQYEQITKFEKRRYYDPLKHHDFWFTQKN